jgi:hypothetical protein
MIIFRSGPSIATVATGEFVPDSPSFKTFL